MKVVFSKVARHRIFDHQPIYFDQAKEDKETREHNAKSELGLLSEKEKGSGYSDRIRGGMRRRIKPSFEVNRNIKRKSNIRLVIILIILTVLATYLVESSQEWYAQFVGQ